MFTGVEKWLSGINTHSWFCKKWYRTTLMWPSNEVVGISWGSTNRNRPPKILQIAQGGNFQARWITQRLATYVNNAKNGWTKPWHPQEQTIAHSHQLRLWITNCTRYSFLLFYREPKDKEVDFEHPYGSLHWCVWTVWGAPHAQTLTLSCAYLTNLYELSGHRLGHSLNGGWVR